MKIVNVENGKKKIYVQLNDVMMLMQFEETIPAEIFNKIFSNVFIVTDENRFEFAEFVEPGTIKFFEECDWIPDFRKYKNMTEEEIIADGQTIGQKMNDIGAKWNAMSQDERQRNQKMLLSYEKLDFKMKSAAEILWTKQGHRVMPFPVVPDYEGFKLAEHEGCPYIAQQGLNPLQVLVFRIDGAKLDEDKEVLPQGLIQTTETLLINDNLEHNEFFGAEFNVSRCLSEDEKYLVTTFKINPPQEKEDTVDKEVKQDNDSNERTKKEEPKTLAKRIKAWIDRRFK